MVTKILICTDCKQEFEAQVDEELADAVTTGLCADCYRLRFPEEKELREG